MQKWQEKVEVKRWNGPLILDIFGQHNPSVEDLVDDDFQTEMPVVDQQQASLAVSDCWLIYPHHLLSEMKTGIHTPALDTRCMSPEKWYCPSVSSQCSAICSNCFWFKSVTLVGFLVQKRVHPCWGVLPSSLQFNRTCWYIHNSHPSHYNSFCYCKFFAPELPQVHSHTAYHWTTHWLSINLLAPELFF